MFQHITHRWQPFLRIIISSVLFLIFGVLFGKNLFLRIILTTDHTPISAPTEACQLVNWPPASDPGNIEITGYDVGENKLTSVMTGRKEGWVPIKSYLIIHGEKLILVDPGPDRRRAGFLKDWTYNGIINHLVNPIRLNKDDQIGNQTKESGDVSLIVLNHAHSDHTGNLDLFPKAETIINQVEYDHAIHEGPRGGDNPAELDRAAKLQTVSLADAPPIATFAHGLDLLGDQTVYLVDLPGHTPGQTGVLVRTKTKTWLLSSDALARAKDLEEMYAMPGQSDRKEFLASLHQIDCFQQLVPSAVILPGHDEPIGPRQ